MDIDKFKKNLKKIINFNDWSDNEKVKLTRIEKDILLDYIRKLYNSVLKEKFEIQNDVPPKLKKFDNAGEVKSSAKVRQPKQIEDIDKTKPYPVTESNKSAKVEDVKAESKIEEEVISIIDGLSVEELKHDDVKTLKVLVSDEFLQIFKEKNSNELSEKLGMLPVNDLRKAFGLNEKIFTVNELFDGDSNHFDNVINDLNLLSSFSDAKEYIISNLIVKYKWDTELKLKKAEQFVKTIRRRYS